MECLVAVEARISAPYTTELTRLSPNIKRKVIYGKQYVHN